MRCPECAVELADPTRPCGRCGAPAAVPSSVAADSGIGWQAEPEGSGRGPVAPAQCLECGVEMTDPARPCARCGAPAELAGSQRADMSPVQGASPARRGKRRIGMLAAAAIVVVAGGVTAAALARSSPGDSHATQLAALPEPGGATPNGVAFKSDGTLVIVDSADRANSWDIATGRFTPTDADAASVLVQAMPVAGALSLLPGSQGSSVQAWNSATNEAVATLVPPGGGQVTAYALSPDGTEAAVADIDGYTYVWKITR